MLIDTFQRPIKDLRISVTDRCNFRCSYCMPFDEYVWIDREEILTFEEIELLARVFVDLGVERIRLTGGEPLLRKDLHKLISRLSSIDSLKDLCLTTNGAYLAKQAAELKSAGLRRINLSLDTLDHEKFKKIVKRGSLSKVLEGLFMAKSEGFQPIKINAVIERGVNDEEIIPLVEFSMKHGFDIRFIEFMDVGNANKWKSDKMVPKKEILKEIEEKFSFEELGREQGRAPAVDYQLSGTTTRLGVIASVTEPFCSGCTRARLTADGKLVTCLFSEVGENLKMFLRQGASVQEMKDLIKNIWKERNDRYSEKRWEALYSENGYRAEDHKKIEMISLGG
ncbi:MAG: GTP 3',8-cyclase MoaA [Acidobacteriia bacterium]|mgnify:FL=1|nr:GTP 3',8-cyclase MoaA [Terriglobia bacterium]